MTSPSTAYREPAPPPEPDASPLDPVSKKLTACPYCGNTQSGSPDFQRSIGRPPYTVWVEDCITTHARSWVLRIFGAEPITRQRCNDQRLHVHAYCGTCGGKWKVAKQ